MGQFRPRSLVNWSKLLESFAISTACIFLLIYLQCSAHTLPTLSFFDLMFNYGESWRDTVGRKLVENEAKIPLEWRLPEDILSDARKIKNIVPYVDSILDEDTRTITNFDFDRLTSCIRQGTLTSVQVVTAFCKRAAYAHQLNRNLLEINFDEAMRYAEKLDRFFATHRRLVGPLHGLPYTTKDQWHIKGLETTMGYVGWIGTFEGQRDTGREKTYQSELIDQLEDLGAVPIGKTTLMQTLWWGETDNNILGYNYNPNHQGLSSGGSSGGEAAMTALRGSAFGVASEIGGSLTLPSSYNGVYGFKPSTGRISFMGAANSSPGQAQIPTVAGLMGSSISALRTVFASLLSLEPWLRDPEVLPIPYRADWDCWHQKKQPLSIAFMQSDGIVTPHPPIIRGLKMVEQALRSSGHQTMEWDPPSHAEARDLHWYFTTADGNVDVYKRIKLSGEPIVPEIKDVFEPGVIEESTVPTYFNMTMRLRAFRAKYQQYWQSTKERTNTKRPVDAIILPSTVSASTVPGKSFYYTYGSLVNVLDYTSVVVPVTTASADKDKFNETYKPLNDKDKAVWKGYDPKAYDGAPVAVHVICQTHSEEKVLAIAQIVVEALKRYKLRTGQK